MTTEHATAGEPVGLATKHDTLPREAPPHSRKFRVALATLIGIAVGAIAVAIVVLVNSNGASAAKAGHWSAWAPSTDGSQGVTEIASHIGPLYKLNPSTPLDVVKPLSVSQTTSSGTTSGAGVTVVVDAGGKIANQSLELLNGKTVAYSICGSSAAADCTLPGTASASRLLLMRREALELALYTFKYIGDSQNVVAVLPPAHTTTGANAKTLNIAVLFVRKELQPLLDRPLAEDLTAQPPSTTALASWSQSDEAALVNEVTEHWLFTSQIESDQTVGKLLILNPITS